MPKRYWLGGLLLCAWGCGAPGSEEHTSAARSHVAGTQDAEGLFSGVVGVVTRKGEFVARCTGALVAPDLMLTARHCVAFDDGDLVTCGQASLGAAVAAEDVLVTALPTQSDTPSDYVTGAEIIAAPGGDDTCGFDFAAVRLAGAPPGATGVYAPRLDSSVVAGEVFTAVGYGSTGSTGVGARRYNEGASVACAAEQCPIPEVQPNEWLASDGAFCRADSGAAAIDAQGRLIGTVSRGQGTCSTPILAAMPAWKDWLVEVARQAASAAGNAAPDWAAEAMEPPVVEPGDSTETQPSLQSTCSVVAPVPDESGLFWLMVALVVQRCRHRARAMIAHRSR